MMKFRDVATRIAFALACTALHAPGVAADTAPKRQTGSAWQPSPGHHQIPLWPKGTRLMLPATAGPETARTGGGIAGRPVTAIENVTVPTMTVYSPKGANNGAAIMVFPGGGYEILAIDLEGTEICDWATAAGMTCVVLKYRVPHYWHPNHCGCDREPLNFLPLQDAERAMGLLRERAGSLGIDPQKIGVIGFSAGGHLVTAISNAVGRSYAPVDAADRISARPNFAIALYPGHLWSGHGIGLHAYDPVRSDAPPTFIAQAENDPVDDVRNSIAYFLALRAAKVPAEMHLYAEGGHAYGLRPTAKPITIAWPKLAEKWLQDIGMIGPLSKAS